MTKWMYQWVHIPSYTSERGSATVLNEQGALGWEATGISNYGPGGTSFLMKKEYT